MNHQHSKTIATGWINAGTRAGHLQRLSQSELQLACVARVLIVQLRVAGLAGGPLADVVHTLREWNFNLFALKAFQIARLRSLLIPALLIGSSIQKLRVFNGGLPVVH